MNEELDWFNLPWWLKTLIAVGMVAFFLVLVFGVVLPFLGGRTIPKSEEGPSEGEDWPGSP